MARWILWLAALWLVHFGAHAQLPLPNAQPNLDLRNIAPGRAALATGDGGAIIAGDFSIIGDSFEHSQIARILPDGSIDPNWTVSVSGGVITLLRSGDRLFLVGNFGSVNGVTRRGLAEVSLSTGTLAPWDPNAGSTTSYVFSGATLLGSHVYVGGLFTQIGTAARSNLAKIDINSGAPDPTWAPAANAHVATLANDGSAIFAGGSFTNIAGQPRSRAAKLDAASGAALAWAPAFNGQLTGSNVDGNHYYAVGCFSSVDGTPRGYLARLDTASGVVDPTWNPAPGSGCTYALTVTATQVYVGGAFQTLGGQPARTVARVSKSGTGAIDAGFAPQLSGGVFTFGALELAPSSILLYGDFTNNGSTYSPGIVRVNAAGSALLPAIYGENRGYVYSLLDLPDGGTLVGGVFTRVRNAGAAGFRRGLLRLDASGAFDPAFTTTTDGGVEVMRRSGSTVYIGGYFANIGGVAARNLARMSQAGVVDAGWLPQPSNGLTAMALDDAAGRVFIGGWFSNVGGQNRNRLAEVQISDASVTAWNPGADGGVFALEQDASGVYAAGEFLNIGGVARQRLAKLSRTGTGAVDMAFSANANSGIRALLLGPGDSLYVGGYFSTLGTLGRPGFGRLLRSTGAPDPAWNSFLSGGWVESLSAASDGLYVGGGFGSIASQARQSLARVSHTGAVAPLFAPNVPGGVFATQEHGARVHVGGFLNYAEPVATTQIGALTYARDATPVSTVTTISSDQPENSQPFQTYLVSVNVTGTGNLPAANQSVLVSDDLGAACTAFLDGAGNGSCEIASREAGTRTLTARFAGVPLMSASSDTEPHTVSGTSSTPPVNTAIDLRTHSAPFASVRLSDGSLVIGGAFTRVGNLPRRGLAKLRPDGTLDPNFSADVIGAVYGLARDGNDNVYVSGSFGYIDGVLRRNLAKLDANGNVIPGWTAGNPWVTSSDRAIAVDAGGDLFMAGQQLFVSGSPSYFMVPLTKLSGSDGSVVTGFSAELRTTDTSVSPYPDVMVSNGHLYAYGRFDQANGVARRNLARFDGQTGVLDAGWNPAPNQFVRTLVPDGSGGVYVGGSYTEIAGQPVSFAARLDGTGTLIGSFSAASNSDIQQFLPFNGALYTSGYFSSIGGLSRSVLVKLDPLTGAADPAFVSPASVFPGLAMNALGSELWAPASSNLFSATDVRIMGGVRWDAATGAELATDFVSRPARVFALARQPDGGTLIGGNFARLGSLQRNLVRVTAAGQYDTGFLPPLSAGSSVQAIKVLGDGTLYVGESFRVFKLNAAGTPVAAFGSSGSVSTNSNVMALAAASDGLLVGGFFSTIGGVSRNGLAKLDFTTGAVASYNAALSSGGVRALALDGAENLYLGGGFSSVNGTARARLAKLDSSGALIAGWQADANSTVLSLMLDGAEVYAGGFFTTLGGISRRGLARLATSNAAVSGWNPAPTRQVYPYALAKAQDGGILVGGSFNFIGGEYRSNAAKLDATTGIADPVWNPSFDATVYAILPGYGDTPTSTRLPHIEQNIAFGGDFEFAGATPMPGFVAVPAAAPAAERIFCGGFEDGGCSPLP